MEKLTGARVMYTDGTVIETSMAPGLSNEEIKAYFAVGRPFNLGEGERDNMQQVVAVEIL